MPTIPQHPLTGVAALPLVTVVNPGFTGAWTDATASGVITPGEAVVLTQDSTGAKRVRKATGSDVASDLFITQRSEIFPDPNTGPNSLGPVAVVNTPMQNGEYVARLRTGRFATTLFTPGTYAVGDRIGWDVDGVRQTGQTGTGAWAKNSAADVDDMFRVTGFRQVGSVTGEGVLTIETIASY